MRRAVVVVSFIVMWVAVTIVALLWGFVFDWPDYFHINYGLPKVWATHTLSTIVGLVDRWRVDLVALLVDLIFWLGLMAVAVTLLLYLFKPKSSDSSKSFDSP